MTKKLTVVSPEAQAIAVAAEAGDIDALKNISAMATGLKEAAKKRGLGIADENKAAEVVIRAERAIGQVLLRMQEEGALATRADSAKARKTEWGPGLSRVAKTGPELASETLTIADLGLGKTHASNFKQLAKLDDDVFEGLLASKRDSVERIAKVDFYRLAEPAREYTPPGYAPGQQVPPTEPMDPAFVALRDATRLILGYVPDGQGGGEYTSNALLTMHVDDLKEVAGFIQRLAAAYGEAKNARSA